MDLPIDLEAGHVPDLNGTPYMLDNSSPVLGEICVSSNGVPEPPAEEGV